MHILPRSYTFFSVFPMPPREHTPKLIPVEWVDQGMPFKTRTQAERWGEASYGDLHINFVIAEKVVTVGENTVDDNAFNRISTLFVMLGLWWAGRKRPAMAPEQALALAAYVNQYVERQPKEW